MILCIKRTGIYGTHMREVLDSGGDLENSWFKANLLPSILKGLRLFQFKPISTDHNFQMTILILLEIGLHSLRKKEKTFQSKLEVY